MSSERSKVTVIGLGSMGSALADVFLKGGHETTVWNRSADKARPLVDRGANAAASVEEAVAASSVVVVCVLDYGVVRSLLDPVAGSLSGRTLVNLSSGSPEQARETEAWAREHGAEYLDGGIMATPPGVGDPRSMMLFSGSPEVFDAHRSTLSVLGEPLYLGADPGRASLYDTALLGLMWSTFTGWLHGTAVVGADGSSAVDFTEVAIRWLTTVSGFMTTYAAQVDEGRYPGDDATVDVQIATIDHLVHAARARGVDNALPELLKATMERAAAKGHGSDGYASVIEVLRRPADAR
ncbi:NAD(P)-dependent oxidoreductase [Nocardiopsis alba]|uniref:NAD(P)-dependent oxidoreductase n=1 Tax=Nocardiopsis alba TaxID=53437 RepID=UPI0033F4F76B